MSNAIFGLLSSPKKRTDEFVLFAFLLFMANKSNSSVHFLGESTNHQSAFRFFLTFSSSPIRTTEDDYRPSLSPSGIAPAANCTLWNKISKITAE